MLQRLRTDRNRRREREVEHRAVVDLRLRPDRAAVAADDALHGREADAGAGKFFGRMQPLKRAKELVGVGHVEAGAVVADEIHRRSALIERVNQRVHSLRGGTYTVQAVAAAIAEPLAVILFQNRAEAVDAAERRAQIVRHRVAEVSSSWFVSASCSLIARISSSRRRRSVTS